MRETNIKQINVFSKYLVFHKRRMTYFLLIGFFAFLEAESCFAQSFELCDRNIYTTIISGGSDYQFQIAHYTLFIPKGLINIRGILIHQHGCTMEGTGQSIATDIQYQAFAKKWDLAILGPDITPHEKKCMEWSNPDNGSEDALFVALDSLAMKSGHPEINTAPWLLWGHSGGGHWVLSMLSKHPDRIIAVVSYSAAFDPSFNYPESAAKVPVLLRHAGEGDINESWAKCWATAVHQFSTLRNKNGLASIVHNLNQTHNLSYIRQMAIPYFESVLAQRLPCQGFKLLDMDITKAWLGDTAANSNMKIYKASTYSGSALALSWLPDSVCAAKYKEFILSGTIQDKTAPPSPYDVNMKAFSPDSITITWKADADIESGIKCFNFYKNDKFLLRYPTNKNFQSFDSNGDNPIPAVAPEMRIQISRITFSKDDIFKISTVNGEGLESLSLTVH